MTQPISGRPQADPPPHRSGRPDVRDTQHQSGTDMPSLAQFALNQSLHRSPVSPGSEQGYRSLSIFKDNDSGRFVTLFRDGDSGQVTEQIPDERLLEFYVRMERELEQRLSRQGNVDVKA